MRPLSIIHITLFLSLFQPFPSEGRIQSEQQEDFNGINGCQTSDCIGIKPMPEAIGISTQWFQVERSHKVTGVALVIHGLNLAPEKMKPIISHLTNSGIEVLNLSLHGHGCNYYSNEKLENNKARLESFKSVTYALWTKEILHAYHQIKQRSLDKNLPIFFLGYSLGGLLGLDLFTSNDDIHFNRMVLFAPAIGLHPRVYLLKSLSWFPNLVIPSFSPKPYQANRGTPIAAYNSFFQALTHFKINTNSKINIPTIIFIDPYDEFVSYDELKKMKEKERFYQWKFFLVIKNKTATYINENHLIIDKPSIGEGLWETIMEITVDHFLSQENCL